MSIFEWKQEYETGIDTIDNQHRYLVDLINQLDDVLHQTPAKQGMDLNTDLEEIYTQLFDYTVYHFNYEEQLMEQSSTYPDKAQAAHKKQHDQFIRELKSVLNDFQDVRATDGEVILSFLTNWLINHICKIDQKLASHVEPVTLDQENEETPLEPDALLRDLAQGNQFIQIFMNMSQHLHHHLGKIERQLSEIKAQMAELDPSRQQDEQSEKNAIRNLTERVTRRVQIVQSLMKNLESSARQRLTRKKKD